MSKDQIDKLIAIAQNKNKLIDRIYQITKLQVDEIAKEDIERLNKALDQKDKLIKAIDRLDIEFLTIFSEIKKDNNVEDIYELSPKQYPNLAKLKTVVKEISSRLMAISLLDEKNQEGIKKALEGTKLELRRLNKGKKAYKGYNVPLVDNILIDEKK